MSSHPLPRVKIKSQALIPKCAPLTLDLISVLFSVVAEARTSVTRLEAPRPAIRRLATRRGGWPDRRRSARRLPSSTSACRISLCQDVTPCGKMRIAQWRIGWIPRRDAISFTTPKLNQYVHDLGHIYWVVRIAFPSDSHLI